MYWKKCAEDDLRKYLRQKSALDNIPERIEALRAEYYSAKITNMSSAPVKGGGNRIEDALLNNITKRKRLEYTRASLKRLVDLTERGLAGLSDEERLILETFYVSRPPRHVEVLMERLGYERTRIYEIKDEALYKFTIFQYGLPEY